MRIRAVTRCSSLVASVSRKPADSIITVQKSQRGFTRGRTQKDFCTASTVMMESAGFLETPATNDEHFVTARILMHTAVKTTMTDRWHNLLVSEDEISEVTNPIFRAESGHSQLSQKPNGINRKSAMITFHTHQSEVASSFPTTLTILVNWIGPLLSLSVKQCPELKTATSQCETASDEREQFNAKGEIYAHPEFRANSLFQYFTSFGFLCT